MTTVHAHEVCDYRTSETLVGSPSSDLVTASRDAGDTGAVLAYPDAIGWTRNGIALDSAPEGYHVSYYFAASEYLGPDEDGVEPVIEWQHVEDANEDTARKFWGVSVRTVYVA